MKQINISINYVQDICDFIDDIDHNLDNIEGKEFKEVAVGILDVVFSQARRKGVGEQEIWEKFVKQLEG